MVNSSEGLEHDGREYAPNEELWLTDLQTRVD